MSENEVQAFSLNHIGRLYSRLFLPAINPKKAQAIIPKMMSTKSSADTLVIVLLIVVAIHAAV